MKNDNNDQPNNRSNADHKLSLRVTKDEHDELKEAAYSRGLNISTLLRFRLFGKIKTMRIRRRPSLDVVLLGDIINKLTGVTYELNKIGDLINQIALRLSQSSRDVFGIDSCLRLFERLGLKTLKLFGQIEMAISRRHKVPILVPKKISLLETGSDERPHRGSNKEQA